MKQLLSRVTVHIPRPREEETPEETLRRRLIARASSTMELRRRLGLLT